MTRRSSLSAGLAALALLAPTAARGDWPVGRHDARRTGAADGTSNITAPQTRWRYYLGGALTPAGAASVDLDGDGVDEYVLASGGALSARRADDATLWVVPPRDVHSIVGVADLDGDGGLEVVAGATRGVLVVDAASGEVEWESPAGLMGLLGGARLADLDGDGRDDLVAVPCGPCCGVPSDWPGAAWSFAGGAAAPVELWQLGEATCDQQASLTVFDADGDGDLEVLKGVTAHLRLLDGATGTELGRTPDLGISMQFASCAPFDADGLPGDELACVHTYAAYQQDRSVFVLDWDGAGLRVAWRRMLANQPGEELRALDPALDLGAGPRVAFATRAGGAGPWTTTVVDALTGEEVAVLADAQVAGAAPHAGGGHALLAVGAAGLRGFREGAGGVAAAWTIPEALEPLLVSDRARARRGSQATRAAVLPASGRLLTVPTGALNELRAYDLAGDQPRLAAALELPVDVRVATSFGFDQRIGQPFGMTRSDGYLVPLTDDLGPATGGDDVLLSGIRTGGYYATGTFRQLAGPPRTGDLDGDGRDEVLVADSRGVLVRLDPEDAGWAVPPAPRWVVTNTTAPAITTGPDGGPAFACLQRDVSDPLAPAFAVALRDGDAAITWTSPLPGPPLADVIPASLDGDDVPDVVVQWGAPGDVLLRTRALAGVDGAVLWEDVSNPGAGRAPAGPSAGPWPGQPGDVVVNVGQPVTVLAGADGAPVGSSASYSLGYFLPMLVDADDDPALEVALTGGYWPVQLFDDDLGRDWVSTDEVQRPFPYGAAAVCPSGEVVLVSQSWQFPSRLTLTTLRPEPRGTRAELWLAGGSAYADEPALVAAGAWAGQLTSSTVHQDLAGDGTPAALVGSSDGFLYVVDPCGGTLTRAVRFDAAVGEAVFGDTDGDGRDEILVTVGDGFLHALQHEALGAPGAVADLDVTFDDDLDVDTLATGLPLAARWLPVTGATGYEVALIDEQGRYATSPAWRPVTDTRLVFDDVVPTATGVLYRVAVRAINAEGRSVEALSDGVSTVSPPPDDDEPIPGPQGCCSGSPGLAGGGLAAAVLALLRRRRRTGR